jgi:hypothetical protein
MRQPCQLIFPARTFASQISLAWLCDEFFQSSERDSVIPFYFQLNQPHLHRNFPEDAGCRHSR